jgi:ribosomal protein S12 methylthiotransferase accessory factor
MGKRDPFICLVHDENVMAQDSLAALSAHTRCIRLGAGTPENPTDLVVVHASGQGWEEILATQNAARARSQTVLFITVEPGSMLIGPLLRPDGSGCFMCLKSWLANNHRDGHRWYNAEAGDRVVRRRDSIGPLSPAARAACQAHIGKAMELPATGSSHPLERMIVRVDLDTLASRQHRFLARSHCPYCARLPSDSRELAKLELRSRLKDDPVDDRISNPLLSLERLRREFVDRRTGLVPHVFHDLTSRLMPMFAAEMPIENSDVIEVGYGRSDTRCTSELVAVLEAIERYAGHAPRGKRTSVRASYASLRGAAIDPRAFLLHAPEQAAEPGYTLNAYHDDLEFDWVWGHSFARNAPVLVPAQLAYYWLPDSRNHPVNRFLFDTSSGCSLGGCIEEAALYGLQEVVERDAYLCAWYNRSTPPEILLDSIADARTQALIARTRAEGLELHVFDIRHDINLPVVWAMIADPQPDAPVKSYCAAGAHLRPVRAIYSALVEVTTSMGVYQRTLPALRGQALSMLRDSSQVQRMSDHVLLYSLREAFDRLTFLFGGPRVALDELYPPQARAPNLDLTEDLRASIAQVLRVAQDVVVVDQSFEAMRDSGLYCAKVLVPGLLPMTFGHQYRRLGLERLRAVALANGRTPPPDVAALNPHPHNFP